jgi:hypothetical protein
MSVVVIIDENIKLKIKQLMMFAEKFVVTTEQLKLMIQGVLNPIGNDPRHFMIIPSGYRVVYSVEEQPRFLAKHISISVKKKGMYPHIEAVNEIISEFGFHKISQNKNETNLNQYIYCEEESNAINIIEKF